MLENKFGELFEESVVSEPQGATAPPPQFGPFLAANQIYQAAYEQALRDHQLDLLFNPDYYGDHGSGI
ncbi:MAG TPA: hypothetical protein VGM76_18210 [Lacipirellulaceae bacterium]|jgi:hypothetical protein